MQNLVKINLVISDAKTIVSHFAEHFSKVCTNSTIAGTERLMSAMLGSDNSETVQDRMSVTINH